MADAPANNAQLTATIKFIAKMDEKSFGAVKNTLKQMNGESGGESGAQKEGETNTPTKPNTRAAAESITRQPNLAEKLPGVKPEDDRYQSKTKYDKENKDPSGGASEIMSSVGDMLSGKGVQAPKEEREGSGKGGMGAGGAAMVGIGAAMKIFESIFAVLQKIFQLIMDSSPLLQSVGKLFMTSMKLLFMPIGNMIGKVLMPIMMKYMQKSVDRMSKLDGTESIQELTTGAMTDMIGALIEVFQKVVTDIMPAVIMGIVDGIKAALNPFGNTETAVKNSMSKYQDEYNKNIEETNSYLTEFNSGLADGLDRFGMVINTSNNKSGKAMSDMATVVYSSARTIENGFDETSTVYVQGTTKMINTLDKAFNLVAAGATFTYNTITGQAQAFGTKLTQALKDIGGAFNSFISPIKTPITQISTELGKLATPIAAFNRELGNMVATVANTIAAIEMKLRNDSISDLKAQAPKFKSGLGDASRKLIFEAAQASGEKMQTASLNPEDYKALGITNAPDGVQLYLRSAGGAYMITDVYGNNPLGSQSFGFTDINKAKSLLPNADAINKLYQEGGFKIGGVESGGTFGGYANVGQEFVQNAVGGSGPDKGVIDYVNNLLKTQNHASGTITNGPQRAVIGEAGKEAVVPLDDDLTSRYSNEEIFSRLKNATTPGISNLDQKIDSASGANKDPTSTRTNTVPNSTQKPIDYTSLLGSILNKINEKILNKPQSDNTNKTQIIEKYTNEDLFNAITSKNYGEANKTIESTNTNLRANTEISTNKKDNSNLFSDALNKINETSMPTQKLTNDDYSNKDLFNLLSNKNNMNLDTEKKPQSSLDIFGKVSNIKEGQKETQTPPIDKYSNEEIYKLISTKNTPRINDLDKKVDSVASTNNTSNNKKQVAPQVTLQVIIQGDVYGIEKIETAVKGIMQQNAYLLKGSY